MWATLKAVLLCALLVLAITWNCPGADVTVPGMTHFGATLVSVGDKGIDVEIFTGKQITIKHEDIIKIQLGGAGDRRRFDDAESLMSEGNFEKAISLYEVIASTSDDEVKRLLPYRLARAKRLAAGGAASVASSQPAAPKVCPICRGGGTVDCTACNGTGLGRCPNCLATIGRVPCPRCQGNWKGRPCWRCNGTGQVKTGEVWTGAIVHPIFGRCPNCNGVGRIGDCPTCSRGPQPGTVVCPDCKGSGRKGVCPICNGTKRAPCPLCAKRAADLGELKTTSTSPAQDAQPQPPAKSLVVIGPDKTPSAGPPAPVRPKLPTSIPADPLSSPDALMLNVQNPPMHPREEDPAGWSQLTQLQRDEAEKDYGKRLGDWKSAHDFRGKKVTWRLNLDNVDRNPDGDGFVVKAISEGGAEIRGLIAPTERDALLKLKKGQRLDFSATIKDYAFASPDGADTGPGLFTDRVPRRFTIVLQPVTFKPVE